MDANAVWAVQFHGLLGWPLWNVDDCLTKDTIEGRILCGCFFAPCPFLFFQNLCRAL